MAHMRWLLNSLGASPEHPGEVLRRVYMQPHHTSQNELARRLGVTPRLVNEIIHGKRAITARTALLLAGVYGGDGMDWLERQAMWDLHQARRALGRRRRKPRSPSVRQRNAAELQRRDLALRLEVGCAPITDFQEFQEAMRAFYAGGCVGPKPRWGGGSS